MADVVIRDDRPGRRLDRRVLGTNVPAWLGPETLADPTFRSTTVASGVTTARMPGGSWSNGYDWLACENGDDGCFWTWAARPSDFAAFLRATGLAGVWTVSINASAQSSAAAVAFFNGSVDDDRAIGVDRDGVDWQTVGTWARLRAAHGNPDPVRIETWEVGNEVYGGRPDAGGEQCASFGWEDVWTCDGTEYVRGDERHDGFLDHRRAMVAVDPAIRVGAVGVGDPASWSEWGHEVIESAGEGLDFYIVHQYGFDRSPPGDEAVRRPADMWPALLDSVRSALPETVPIAVTEYNLVSFEAGDTDRSMTRAMNALYVADSIGQFAVGGVELANHWNLANGTTSSGTDYGMIDVRDGSVFPQYHAMSLWGATGAQLLELEVSNAIDDVRIYPTRRADGSLAVILINVGAAPTSLDIGLAGTAPTVNGTLRTLRADDLRADDLIEDDPIAVTAADGQPLTMDLPAWSLSLLEVAPRG